ncbi:MAG: hypothetical protein CBC79_02530 [Gammaproteobacteria bacterium TMED119]|mgnify:CR=1 FL=1|nr:MAG: hypothetical protein CBC79_02530 [Gammaproteobacteria bacterium TMED119]RCL46555.1 MAG: DUF423 domain-containing protein [Candidatus Thioglobus sp.]|tara:strand:- start:564 stop:941 length:378 start_codon:yes stop_codon:yes gene_type:complete
MRPNVIISLGSFNAAVAIMLGAFAAHGLKNQLDSYSLDIFNTAADFHLVHAIGLIVLGLIAKQYQQIHYALVGYLLIVGIILFSGSLYALSISGWKMLGMVTPFGGISFIVAWIVLSYQMIMKAD